MIQMFEQDFKEQKACMLYEGKKYPLRLDKITYPNNQKEKEEDFQIITYHGTLPENIESIFKDGFDIKKLGSNSGNKGHLGPGIYSSRKIEQAIYYCYKAPYDERLNFELIGCKVSAKKIETVSEFQFCKDIPKEYDARHREESGEIVVFDQNKILPYCILHISICVIDK